MWGTTQQRQRGPKDLGREIMLVRTRRGQGMMGTCNAKVDPLGIAGRGWEPLKFSLSKEMT